MGRGAYTRKEEFPSCAQSIVAAREETRSALRSAVTQEKGEREDIL